MISNFYASRHSHSSRADWLQRLAAGEISRNGGQLWTDGPLAAGDRLSWHRPPWHEPAVPALPRPLFDDGDLLVFDKPAGLPVLPAGGFLEHTLLRQIEQQVASGRLDGAAGLPRPVHRLGRWTSGLLLCARRPATRAWLSALLRESTASCAGAAMSPGSISAGCCKTYRALLEPPAAASPLLPLQPGETLEISAAIGRCRHQLLERVWAVAEPGDPAALPARSRLRLLRGGGSGPAGEAWLVEVEIGSGRPHQIRIHAAVCGAPLQGDPLYRRGGTARHQVLPGAGGYHLHAHRLRLPLETGEWLALEAPLPGWLRTAADV